MADVIEIPAPGSTRGVQVADLHAMESRPGDRVHLTFYWRDLDRWEGSDFLVGVE